MKPEDRPKTAPMIESVQRIEPARLEEAPEAISNLVAEIAAASAKLGHSLNPAHRGKPCRSGAHHEHLLQQSH